MLLRLCRRLLRHLGRDLRRRFRSEGRCAPQPGRQRNARSLAELRENAGGRAAGKQRVEQTGPLRAVRVAEELAHHLGKRRSLIGVEHRRDPARQVGRRGGLRNLMKMRIDISRAGRLSRLRIILQNVGNLIDPAHDLKFRKTRPVVEHERSSQRMRRARG